MPGTEGANKQCNHTAPSLPPQQSKQANTSAGLRSPVVSHRRPPPTPEDALAAQLAQLGELDGENSTLSDKSSAANAAAGGGNSSKGKGKGGKEGGGDKLSGSSGGEGGIMFCSSCGRKYSAAAAEESFSRAKSAW